MSAVQRHAPAKPQPSAPPGPIVEFWHYFAENRGAVAGLFIVLLVVFVALTAQWIAPYGPAEINTQDSLTPPVWQEGGPGSICSAPIPWAATSSRGSCTARGIP